MAIDREISIDSGEIREEVLSRADALSLDLSEEKIRDILRVRLDNAESWWNKKLNLKKLRDENEKRWLNKNLEVAHGDDLYDFQVPYRDNRIFISIETLLSNLVAKIPVPEVIEAFDTDASRELAENYGKVLYRKAEDMFLKGKLQMAARHLLMGKRVGILKVYWDFSAGRLVGGKYTGDVKVDFVLPERIVIAEGAEDPDDIPIIAETMKETVEELVYKFPEKKEEFLKRVGARMGKEKVDMATKVGYREIWFTFLDSDGNRREGVCWRYGDLILDYGINPHFNYDNRGSNFLERPYKPYIFFNFLRSGKHAYDDTSLTEQAAVLQDVLEKRGRQIVESADQAVGTRIFNIQQIDAGAAEKYTGDPRQNILVKGDVRTAFFRFPPELLPSYVLEDKYDARREIDNVFATHAPLRGEKTESPTLGQEMLSQRSDVGRQVTISEAIERGALMVYKHMTQLYKVFAKEEHIVKYVGPETGRTTFVNFNRDKIEDGMEIRIRAGSMKADDKVTDRIEAVELAKTGKLIDPLTFAEKWHIEKPLEKARRAFYFMFMPDRYEAEFLGGGDQGGEQDAMAVIQQINSGENVPPKKNASKEYLAFYNQFIRSPAFKQLDPVVQRLHIEHLRGTTRLARGGIKEGGQKKSANLLDKVRGVFKKNA